jgi:hypothetical protein
MPPRRTHRYTRAELDEIRRMADQRCTGGEIAARFNTTPDRLYCLMRYHGIRLSDRPRVPRRIPFLGKTEMGKVLAQEADRRGLSCREFVCRLLTAIVEDNMFNAILED